VQSPTSTESSNHRPHDDKLHSDIDIMHKLIFAAVIASCLAIPVHADENVVDRPNAPAEQRPTLDQLMKKFAEHEARYFPFHITFRETFQVANGVSDDIRKRHEWRVNKRYGNEVEVAQAKPKKWVKVLSQTLRNKIHATVKFVSTSNEVHTFREAGASAQVRAHSTRPRQFMTPSPLLGIFPLRTVWPSEELLVSEYFKLDPSKIQLYWDGPNAVLDFEYGESEALGRRFRLWLSPKYDWHPIRLQRFMNPSDRDFADEWEATVFYDSTTGHQVRAGRIQYRDRAEISDPLTERPSQSPPATSAVDNNETGLVGRQEERRPVAYVMEFVVENTTYGSGIDEAVFAVTAPPNRVGEVLPNRSPQIDKQKDLSAATSDGVEESLGAIDDDQITSPPQVDEQSSGWDKLRLELVEGEIELLDLIEQHDEQHPSVVGLRKRLQVLRDHLARHDAGQVASPKRSSDAVEDYLQLELVKADLQKSTLIESLGGDHPGVVAKSREIERLKLKLAEHVRHKEDLEIQALFEQKHGQPNVAAEGDQTHRDATKEELISELAKVESDLAAQSKNYGEKHLSVLDLKQRAAALRAAVAAAGSETANERNEAGQQRVTDPAGSIKAAYEQAMLDMSRSSQRSKSFIPPADRKFAERQRDLFEVTFRESEQESLAAAAAYRAEAAQKSPDADALKELRARLQVAVKKSFEAQTRFQEARLHLAELDLQNVKAKLERRKTLGEQVIDRRIEDLKAGSDLSWQTAGNASSDRRAVANPTIASRGIEHRDNISQEDAPASSVLAVENEHGDGNARPDFSAGRELLYFRASYCQPCQKMDPIVKDLAEQFPTAIRFVDVGKSPEVVREHRVDRIPTIVMIESEVEIARMVGVQSKERLLMLLKTPTETSTRVNMVGGRNRDTVQEAETTEAAFLEQRLKELNERFEELKRQKLIDDKLVPRNPAAETAAAAKQPGFPTPLELLNHLTEKLNAKDYLAVARMLPEDEVLHEAGRLIVAAKAVGLARKAGATVDPVVATLENVVDSQLLADPPDDAECVLENTVPITTTVFSLSTWLNEFDKHRDDPVQRKRMRQIAGALKDPAKLLAGLAHEFEDSILKKPFAAYGDPNWDIAMDGEDRCRVGNSNARGRYATLDLKRTDNGWVIARFFVDAPEVANAAIVMEGQAAATADRSNSTQPAADHTKLLADWLKQARALGDDAEEKRDKAVREIAEALNAEEHSLQIVAATALAQLGDVKFDKKEFRPRILELCRSKNADVQRWAFYALLNNERQDGDLALLQEVMAEPVSGRLAESASHLLQSFDEGVIRGKSEEIVMRLLNSSDKSLRREALRGLWGAKYGDTITNRVIVLVDNKESHHDAIYYALSTSPEKTPAAIDKLIEVLSDPDWNNWGRAIWGLGYGVPEDQQTKVAAAMLQMYELRSDPKTRSKCERLVREYGDEKQVAKLESLTADASDATPKP